MSMIIEGDGYIRGQVNVVDAMRNRLINTNFAVNQLVKSGTIVLAAGAYGHDGWKAGSGGCTYTFAQYGRDFLITIVSGTLVQIIDQDEVEDGRWIGSWYGTSQARFNTDSYGASPRVIDMSGSRVLQIEFNAGTLTWAQVELNANATQYERRRFGTELAICQRYFSKSFQYGVAPGTNTGVSGGGEDFGNFGFTAAGGTSMAQTVRFPVPMRSSNPTVTTYDANGASNASNYVTTFTSGGGQQNNQPATVDNKSERGFKVFVSANTPARVFFHWTADCRL